MTQYAALESYSEEYKKAKTVGEAKVALESMGLDLSNFETLVKSCYTFSKNLKFDDPNRCLVKGDLVRLISDKFSAPNPQHFENWGLRYFEEPED